MSAGAHNDPHFTDFEAMGLKAGRGQNAFGILRQPPRPVAQPKPAKKYLQMTKVQKAASVFMTPAERKVFRAELAAAKK